MALNEILVVIMFFTFISLLFTGFPIAWVLAGTSVLFTAIGGSLEYFGVSLGGFYEVNFTVFKATINRIYKLVSRPKSPDLFFGNLNFYAATRIFCLK